MSSFQSGSIWDLNKVQTAPICPTTADESNSHWNNFFWFSLGIGSVLGFRLLRLGLTLGIRRIYSSINESLGMIDRNTDNVEVSPTADLVELQVVVVPEPSSRDLLCEDITYV